MDVFVLRDSITAGMTDEEFFRFCMENRDLRIERNSDLQIIIMSPTTSLTGKLNNEISRQLANWNLSAKTGEVFDSSAGFTLRDRSVLSPDACWISKDRWASLTEEQKNQFAPICPEFVIELRSRTDSLANLQAKLRTWLKNGSQLGWLIDPVERKTYIFCPDQPVEVVTGFDRRISGKGPVTGFELDLSLLND